MLACSTGLSLPLSSPPKSTESNNPSVRLSSAEITFTQCLTYKGQLVMRGKCMKRGMSPCPARPVFRLQFLLKVGQCFRLVSPLRVRTGDAAASTELQRRPFYISPAHSNRTSVIRYTPAPPPSPHQNRFISYQASHHSSRHWRHLQPRPLPPDWIVAAFDS